MLTLVWAFVQVLVSLPVKPSTSIAASYTAVSFSIGALTGLAASTAYTITLDRGDGTVSPCWALGTSDATGALPAQSYIPNLSATYSTTGNNTAVLTLYLASQCREGWQGVQASAVPIGRGTATIQVCEIVLQLAPTLGQHGAPHPLPQCMVWI